MRQLLLFLCSWIAIASIGLNEPTVAANQAWLAQAVYQSSPLTTSSAPTSTVLSPLSTPAAALPVSVNGSPFSLVLVTLLLVGVAAVVALVYWRQP